MFMRSFKVLVHICVVIVGTWQENDQNLILVEILWKMFRIEMDECIEDRTFKDLGICPKSLLI